MKNRIVSGILSDFCKQNNIDSKEEKAFEFLSNYIIMSGFEHSRQIDLDLLSSVDVDPEGGTFGLDSIQFFINDNLILSTKDIDEYIKNHSLKVDIVFVQTKTSSKIDTGDILKMVQGIKDFISSTDEAYHDNPHMKRAYDIYKRLFEFDCARHIDNSSPRIFAYFVTTSEKIHDNIIKFCKNQENEMQKNMHDIKSCSLKVLGVDYIIEKYKDIKNTVSVEFNFKSKLELDQIDGVESSYLGYVEGNELLKLIKDVQGDIRKWIFYDNVRDFQGNENPVNKEIEETIKKNEERDKFLLFNNGITVVTKSLKPLGGNNFLIKDYQIVNGCQTCNVIYNNAEHAKHIKVLIKLITTSNDDIICSIVKSNNRQTHVLDEQFLTLSLFHRKLQDLYEAYSKTMPIKLFYERRVGESRSNDQLKDYNIITLHSIIRCVTSIVFKDAYIVYNNNPSNILRNRRDKLFNDEHVLECYYVGNYIFSCILDMRSRGEINFNAQLKYYILMIVFVILTNNTHELNMESKETRKLMDTLITTLKDEEKMSKIIKIACKYVDRKYNEFKNDNPHDILRDKNFNSKILIDLENLKK